MLEEALQGRIVIRVRRDDAGGAVKPGRGEKEILHPAAHPPSYRLGRGLGWALRVALERES
jgi:hypothetical protein